MPLETFFIDGDSYEIDPDTLTPSQKAQLGQKIKASKEHFLTLPGLPGPKQTEMKESVPSLAGAAGRLGSTQQVFDKLMGTIPVTPGDSGRLEESLRGTDAESGAASINKRGLGSLIGLATGGPAGAAIGAAVPPQSPGDVAGSLMGVGAGRLAAPLTRLGGGIKGTLGSAAAGVLENLASLAGRAGVGEDVTGKEAGLSTAMAAAVPMAARGIFRTPAVNSPTANARKGLKQLLGKEVEPSQVAKVPNPNVSYTDAAGKPILAPYSKALTAAKTVAEKAKAERAGALADVEKELLDKQGTVRTMKMAEQQQRNTLASMLRKNRRAVKKAEQELKDIDQNTIKDLRPSEVLNEQTVEELRNNISQAQGRRMFTEVEREAAQKQLAAAKGGQLRVPEGPLDLQVQNQAVETLRNNLATNKLARMKAMADAKEFEDLQMPKVKAAIEGQPAVSPELRHLADASNADEFYKAVETATPANFDAYRAAVGPAGIQAFEKGIATHFAKLAAGPDGTLSNIKRANEVLDYDKIRAAFGNGAEGTKKADMFQDIVNSTMKLIDNNKKFDIKNRIGMAAASSLPFIVLHAASGGNLGTMAAKGAAASAITFAAVSVPAIIEKAISSPEFGKQFQKWAEHDATADAVKKFPLVEKFFHEENVNKDKTEATAPMSEDSLKAMADRIRSRKAN